ncbi:MAG: carbohydrate binding domain-containing protein [Fimbriimonadaceae bacterium]|nr:carbohydrate binding domain-containing protein [Fimbriimonadaceae bacterium]
MRAIVGGGLIGVLVTASAAQEALVANGDFAAGLQGWYVAQTDQLSASLQPGQVGGAKQVLRLRCAPQPGANGWDLQAALATAAPLRAGQRYQIALWLRGPQDARVTLLLQLNREPWSNFFNQTVTLTPAWREITLAGVVTQDLPAGQASVNIQCGAVTGEVELTAVRLTAAGAATAGDLPADQRPANPLGLIPFALPWDDASPSVTNISAWLPRPAGAAGRVVVRDGHLFTGDRRLRIFGTNITSGACFPTPAKATAVAGRLAKFGLNGVRFHHLDAGWANPSIFAADRRRLNPQSLERLGFLIDALKQQGIYSNLNLHVSREYPGLPSWPGRPDFFKGVDNFYPPMIELQRQYARDLLTWRNPANGLRLADDPAVAFVELNNENGLLSSWSWGSLDAMPEVYTAELTKQWNAWLTRRYPTPAALQTAWVGGDRPLGAELLRNRDFAAGTTGWTLEQNASAKGTATPQPGGAVALEVTAVSGEGWHVQFHQAGLAVAADQIYTLTCRARADRPRRISVDCRLAQEPWTTLWESSAELTTQWRNYRFVITPSAAAENARITFGNLGQQLGRIELADLSLRPGGGFQRRAGDAWGRVDWVKQADRSTLPPRLQRDWIAFLLDTERAYWTGLARFVKEELGYQGLVFGSAGGFSPLPVQAELDLVDTHAYWQHPHFPGAPWDSNNWTVANRPMAGVAGGGNLTMLANQRVEGKPFFVTEYNHPAPNTYNSEAFLLLAAYAAFQDWDGLWTFAYDTVEEPRIAGFFSVDSHPTQMATHPAAAALFLRGDVAPGGDPVVVRVTPEKWLEATVAHGPWLGAQHFGLAPGAALQQPVALSFAPGPASALPAIPDGGPIVSRGGQLTWHTVGDRGAVRIDTPRSKAWIGQIAKGPQELGEIVLELEPNLQNWAAVTLTEIDAADLTAPKRILVTATGYAENTAMGWKSAAKDTVGNQWGRAPALVEGIPGRILFPLPAARLRAWALDERGQRRAELPLGDSAGRGTLTIGPAARTLWYEVEVR